MINRMRCIKMLCIVFLIMLPLHANAGNIISDTAKKIGKFVNNGIKDVFEATEQSLEAIFGDDGVLEESLKDIEDVAKNCVLKIDVNDCGDAIGDGLFGASCRILKFGTGMGLDVLETAGVNTTSLGDVVASNNLYPAVERIFEQDLNTPNFSNYIKRHVKFYRSELNHFAGSSRSEERAIYFKTSNPSRALIMHELTHIWQYYTKGLNDFSNDYCEEAEDRGKLPVYEFNLDTNLILTGYGVEQQAQIVENYYLYSEGLRAGCGHDSNFLNCGAIGPNITNALSMVVSSPSLNLVFSAASAGYPVGGTKVVEFNDPLLGNDYNNCSFKKTFGTGGAGYMYNEYEISCTTGVYTVGVEETFNPYDWSGRTCKFRNLGTGVYGLGSCSNWRLYEY